MKFKKYIVALFAITSAPYFLSAVNPNDLDRDGEISWEEFKTLRKKRAAQNGREFDKQQTKYVFKDKDRDGNGVLSYKEFGAHPADLDGDRLISYEEFVALHKKRAKRNDREVSEKWIKNTFPKKDLDGDGVLTFKELATPVK